MQEAKIMFFSILTVALFTHLCFAESPPNVQIQTDSLMAGENSPIKNDIIVVVTDPDNDLAAQGVFIRVKSPSNATDYKVFDEAMDCEGHSSVLSCKYSVFVDAASWGHDAKIIAGARDESSNTGEAYKVVDVFRVLEPTPNPTIRPPRPTPPPSPTLSPSPTPLPGTRPAVNITSLNLNRYQSNIITATVTDADGDADENNVLISIKSPRTDINYRVYEMRMSCYGTGINLSCEYNVTPSASWGNDANIMIRAKDYYGFGPYYSKYVTVLPNLTPSPVPTPSPRSTPIFTPLPSPSLTPSSTPTTTPRSTITPTSTTTPKPTQTPTKALTSTPTKTATRTPCCTPTPTLSPPKNSSSVVEISFEYPKEGPVIGELSYLLVRITKDDKPPEYGTIDAEVEIDGNKLDGKLVRIKENLYKFDLPEPIKEEAGEKTVVLRTKESNLEGEAIIKVSFSKMQDQPYLIVVVLVVLALCGIAAYLLLSGKLGKKIFKPAAKEKAAGGEQEKPEEDVSSYTQEISSEPTKAQDEVIIEQKQIKSLSEETEKKKISTDIRFDEL